MGSLFRAFAAKLVVAIIFRWLFLNLHLLHEKTNSGPMKDGTDTDVF